MDDGRLVSEIQRRGATPFVARTETFLFDSGGKTEQRLRRSARTMWSRDMHIG
jgi:hypothetical protein